MIFWLLVSAFNLFSTFFIAKAELQRFGSLQSGVVVLWFLMCICPYIQVVVSLAHIMTFLTWLGNRTGV